MPAPTGWWERRLANFAPCNVQDAQSAWVPARSTPDKSISHQYNSHAAGGLSDDVALDVTRGNSQRDEVAYHIDYSHRSASHSDPAASVTSKGSHVPVCRANDTHVCNDLHVMLHQPTPFVGMSSYHSVTPSGDQDGSPSDFDHEVRIFSEYGCSIFVPMP